ncbi:MAG: hypothetical protein Q8K00_15640 [Syntrophales bacterium]|nr:hypothetical protein [Syntrophales bacterium]
MPIGKCPGQDAQKLTVSLHPCPQCGYRVEMFSDEFRKAPEHIYRKPRRQRR